MRLPRLRAKGKAKEEKIVTASKIAVETELREAKQRVIAIETGAKNEVTTLRNDLIEQIAKL